MAGRARAVIGGLAGGAGRRLCIGPGERLGRGCGIFDTFTVTAHIPFTNATWGVGGSAVDHGQGIQPFRAIIEFNPGTPPA